MVGGRRPRPTLRALTEDLGDGWDDPWPTRLIGERRWTELHPLPDLPHPLVRKAADHVRDGQETWSMQHIQCSGDLGLLEIRAGQWRAGVWLDRETGQPWLCCAGLAKGDHLDHDDFYEQLAARVQRHQGSDLLPTEHDRRLLKREEAAAALTRWELTLQAAARDLLAACGASGTSRAEVTHPTKAERMATVELMTAIEDGIDVLVVDIQSARRHIASELSWQMTTRLLVSLAPPVQDWDRFGRTFSTFIEGGHREHQMERLAQAGEREELLAPEPGRVAHQVHRLHLSDATVEGRASRAMCGVFVVQTQNPDGMDPCAECDAAWNSLPG